MVNKTRTQSLSVSKKIAFAAVVSMAFFLLLEVGSRLVVRPSDARVYRELQEVITVLGLPAMNHTMEADPYLFWRLKDNLRDVRVNGLIRTREMDFTINTHHHL